MLNYGHQIYSSAIAAAVDTSVQMETQRNTSKTLAGRASVMKCWREFAEEVSIPCEGLNDSEANKSMVQFIQINQLVLLPDKISEKTKSWDLNKFNTVLQ